MPTSHDFNKEMASADSLPLLIGFSGGQIQLIDPLRKDVYNCKLFNKEVSKLTNYFLRSVV